MPMASLLAAVIQGRGSLLTECQCALEGTKTQVLSGSKGVRGSSSQLAAAANEGGAALCLAFNPAQQPYLPKTECPTPAAGTAARPLVEQQGMGRQG